jgi:hypothetical protein
VFNIGNCLFRLRTVVPVEQIRSPPHGRLHQNAGSPIQPVRFRNTYEPMKGPQIGLLSKTAFWEISSPFPEGNLPNTEDFPRRDPWTILARRGRRYMTRHQEDSR